MVNMEPVVVFAIGSGLIITLLTLIILFIANLDCDLSLWYASKFGRRNNSISGKIMWITGASSGIGESLAYRCCMSGAKLVISGTNTAALNEVKRKCLKLNPEMDPDDILVLPFDMKDTACHRHAVDKALAHFNGRIDILVNNAGRSQRAMFHEIETSVDTEMFAINVIGVLSLTRLVLNHWYQTKATGQLVVTSSALGKFGILNASTYSATKHALHGAFESIRSECCTKKISVTMICPGPTFSAAASNAFTSKLGQSFDVSHTSDMRRMKTDRCSQLMMTAIVNQVDEAWICVQPILILYYMSQYAPSITRWFITTFMTPDRVQKLREG